MPSQSTKHEQELKTLQDRLYECMGKNSTLARKIEDQEKELKQLRQHRIELTRAIQSNGRVFQSLSDAMRHLGLSLEHSQPADHLPVRHMED